MRINVLLHEFSRYEPFGGLKQQYELANQLVARGHDVAVYHSLNLDRVVRRPRALAGLIHHNVSGVAMLRWFELDSRVHCWYLPTVKPALLRASDMTIISSALIAARIGTRTTRTGRLIYMVYEYPVWKFGSEELKQNLARALQREDIDYVASSAAVEHMLESFGVRPIGKVTCGISVPGPDLIPPMASRKPIIGFAARPERYKGVDDMLAAIPLVREAHPRAAFECFGRYQDNDALNVEGMTNYGYLDDGERDAFYRRCMVFVSPSYAEGWGLTAAEAMANGAAVVVTDDGGSADFAVDRDTALVVPRQRPEMIAIAIVELLGDTALRTRVAVSGIERSKSMTWQQAVERLNELCSRDRARAGREY